MVTFSNPNPNLHINYLKTQLDILMSVYRRKSEEYQLVRKTKSTSKLKLGEEIWEIAIEINTLREVIKQKENN